MIKKTLTQTDEFEFLRQRAAELLDEGLTEDALRLLTVIDEEQAYLIRLMLYTESKAAH